MFIFVVPQTGSKCFLLKDILSSFVDTDSDHHYESITYEESQYDDFDSFDSDTESEKSLPKTATLVSNFHFILQCRILLIVPTTEYIKFLPSHGDLTYFGKFVSLGFNLTVKNIY